MNIVQDMTVLVGRIAAAIFGAIAGAILTALVVWFVCRLTVNKQPPRSFRKLLRILGAVAGAVAAVMFLPIGYGGFGLGLGGLGLGPGGGGFTPMEAQAPPDDEPKSLAKSQPEQRARIIMLGGPLVRGEAFYRFEESPTPRTLAEVQAELRKRMSGDSPITTLDILIYFEDSLARQSAPVAALADWTRQAGLHVNIQTLSGHIPP